MMPTSTPIPAAIFRNVRGAAIGSPKKAARAALSQTLPLVNLGQHILWLDRCIQIKTFYRPIVRHYAALFKREVLPDTGGLPQSMSLICPLGFRQFQRFANSRLNRVRLQEGFCSISSRTKSTSSPAIRRFWTRGGTFMANPFTIFYDASSGKSEL